MDNDEPQETLEEREARAQRDADGLEDANITI
jgi:hypothetical protein